MTQFARVASRKGPPTLRADLEDGRQVFLHSSYDPRLEAEKWADHLRPRPSSLLVLFGLGMGYPLEALLARSEPGTPVVVVEPSRAVVDLARQWEGSRALLGNPRVHLVRDWEEFKETYQRIATPWDNLFFCRIPAYSEIHPTEYLHFIQKMKKEINSVRTNIATAVSFASRWQANLLRNLCHLPSVTPVARLFDGFQGKPAIVVSAGPSLMKNIDQLKRARGRALIVAVGTVVRLLLERGIQPDFVMSFDGGQANYLHHFKGIPLPDVPLVFDPAVHYQVVENHQGPKVMMLVQEGNVWIEEVVGCSVGMLRVGNSIANTALDFAYRLGADPIVLVGQDIAYGEEGSHADQTFAEGYDRSLQIMEDEQWVEGVDGGMVRTDRRMLNYLHSFEESIRTLDRETTVIDATGGGARIAGTRIQPLDKVLEQYCGQDVSRAAAGLRERCCEPPDYDLAALAAHLDGVSRDLEGLTAACRTGMKLSERLIAHYSEGKPCKVSRVVAKLDRVDRKLRSGEARYAVIHYLMTVVEMFRRARGYDESDDLTISQRSYQLYSVLKQAFEFALPLVGRTASVLAQEAASDGRREAKPGGSSPDLSVVTCEHLLGVRQA